MRYGQDNGDRQETRPLRGGRCRASNRQLLQRKAVRQLGGSGRPLGAATPRINEMMRIPLKRVQAAWPLFLVLAIGLAVRLIALAQMVVINPDGILYIQQAKAISTGQWHLLSQSLSYVSLYPFLIALVHCFVHDWILSGQLLSLCFSMGMLLVVYRILRLFFIPSISWLTTLLFALTPVFVRYSVDVLRDALFWFLFALALWLVLLSIRRAAANSRSSALLLAANCTILLASWSRIEAIVLLPATCLFLLVCERRGNIRRLLTFLAPSACLAVLGWIVVLISSRDVFALVRIDEVVRKFTAPGDAYHALRSELKMLADGYGRSLLGCYLQSSYHTVWITAVGEIFVNAMESFFYPYVLVYVLGLRKAWNRMRHQREYQYLAIVFGCSLGVLFVHSIQYWIMTYRFIAILIIPSCVVAGLGVQKMVGYFSGMSQLGEKRAVALVAFFIFIVAISKNIQGIESDKSVYIAISQQMSALNMSDEPLIVASIPSVAYSWIDFYCNIDRKYRQNREIIASEYDSAYGLASSMRLRGVSLLFWEENAWKKSNFGQNESEFSEYFTELGKWVHKDTGKMILFELDHK